MLYAQQLDVSDANLNRIWKLQDFYSAQLRKSKIPAKLMEHYKNKADSVNNEASAIRENRLNYAEKVKLYSPDILSKESFKFGMRDLDKALGDNEPATVYAHEVSSLVFNAGVSLLGFDKYSQPVIISGEKVLNENWNVGVYAGHFIEKIIVKQNSPEQYPYMTGNKENYKHNYAIIGLTAGYHFFKPLSKLNIKYFDPYVRAMAGYGMFVNTIPFLQNEDDLAGKAYSNPLKNGINYGVFGGLRYMYDRSLGFYLEAGYSNTGYVNAGVTLRFPQGASSAKEQDFIEFKVKIATSKRQLPLGSGRLEGYGGAMEYMQGESYIYAVQGDSTDYGAAQNKLEELQKNKVRNAEIIALNNGELIKIKKALGIVKKSQDPELKKKEKKDKTAPDKEEKVSDETE